MRRAKATTDVGDSRRLSGHSLIGVPDLAFGPEKAKEMSSWGGRLEFVLRIVSGRLQIPAQYLWQRSISIIRYSTLHPILRHASISDDS